MLNGSWWKQKTRGREKFPASSSHSCYNSSRMGWFWTAAEADTESFWWFKFWLRWQFFSRSKTDCVFRRAAQACGFSSKGLWTLKPLWSLSIISFCKSRDLNPLALTLYPWPFEKHCPCNLTSKEKVRKRTKCWSLAKACLYWESMQCGGD